MTAERTLRLAAAVAVPLLAAATGADASPAEQALAPLARLVGGEWHAEGTYQTYSWGVGRRALKATAHVSGPQGDEQISEGFWYFHPESGEVRGVFVSDEAGMDLFEYVTDVEGDVMTSRVVIHGSDGRQEFSEAFEFSDEDHYVWTLWLDTPEGRRTIVTKSYERRPAGSGGGSR